MRSPMTIDVDDRLRQASDDEAMALAVGELRAERAERHRANLG